MKHTKICTLDSLVYNYVYFKNNAYGARRAFAPFSRQIENFDFSFHLIDFPKHADIYSNVINSIIHRQIISIESMFLHNWLASYNLHCACVSREIYTHVCVCAWACATTNPPQRNLNTRCVCGSLTLSIDVCTVSFSSPQFNDIFYWIYHPPPASSKNSSLP